MLHTKYKGSAREKMDNMEIKRDLLEIMKIGARMNLRNPNQVVADSLAEIKKWYDKIR